AEAEARQARAEVESRQARERAAAQARLAARATSTTTTAPRRVATPTPTPTPAPPSVSVPESLPPEAPAETPAGVATPVRPPAAGGEAAVAEAKRQLGKPYEYGSPGPDSFDCSGLTSHAWRAAGKSLPHSSQMQMAITVKVAIDEIQVGDLIFYGSPVHHVGLYAGGGQMVEASQTGTPVRMASIYRRDLVGVGRVK
ncbi:MAG: NlpC/P60 family protein, partial [Acidimicrobiales bacterium]